MPLIINFKSNIYKDSNLFSVAKELVRQYGIAGFFSHKFFILFWKKILFYGKIFVENRGDNNDRNK